MMIATKGRNALKVMLDLAQQPSGTNIPLADIAERVKESQKYLEMTGNYHGGGRLACTRVVLRRQLRKCGGLPYPSPLARA